MVTDVYLTYPHLHQKTGSGAAEPVGGGVQQGTPGFIPPVPAEPAVSPVEENAIVKEGTGKTKNKVKGNSSIMQTRHASSTKTVYTTLILVYYR